MCFKYFVEKQHNKSLTCYVCLGLSGNKTRVFFILRKLNATERKGGGTTRNDTERQRNDSGTTAERQRNDTERHGTTAERQLGIPF